MGPRPLAGRRATGGEQAANCRAARREAKPVPGGRRVARGRSEQAARMVNTEQAGGGERQKRGRKGEGTEEGNSIFI